ncbi:hypothetical protein [Cupriavidus numazuensis]|uniref:Uncharacterized protein n=1 Tax=Cupriavidus numazuensis TaxID=221992 RepID=A0ABM8T9Z3_9BURK|nr:hypothetical protein [Cupriavidus numazuensis]CAG2129224.1 hypothetical protein LMG26411_00140 [Cupriavidus numazuensis]
MSTIRISAAEFEALDGESDELFRLYIGALRPRMDFATGVVGRRPRLSYQALKEWTERAARPGVKYLSHDKSKLQRMLARLQQIGLLRRMGRVGEMIFACPLADRDSTGPKQADTKSIQRPGAAKPRRGKGSRDLSTAGKNAEAATHPASGKTYTPPNPPHDADAGGSGGAVHLAPHACGAGGEQDPQHQQPAEAVAFVAPLQGESVSEGSANPPPHADGAGGKSDPQQRGADTPRPSEERHEATNVGGEGPSARLAERGVGPVTWEADRAWPVRMASEDRRYLVRSQSEVGEPLFQRVLDEWRGAMAAGVVKSPWPYFAKLLQNAQEKGEAWRTDYADKIALARQEVAQTMARQKADDEAFAAALCDAPGYPGAGKLRQLVRGAAQR